MKGHDRKEKEAEHVDLTHSTDQQKSNLLELKSGLHTSDDDEECDSLRAQIITVEADLRALEARLTAKKDMCKTF